MNWTDRISRRHLVSLAAVFLGAMGGPGCAGYQLGPTNGTAAGSRSVEVALFRNETNEPRLSESVAQSLRHRFQQEGTFKLATDGSGDVQVTGTIQRYERDPISFQVNDLLTPRDYDVRLVTHIRAVERTTGKVLLDRDVIARTTIQGNSDLSSAERQATPLLADDLAHRASALLIDGTW